MRRQWLQAGTVAIAMVLIAHAGWAADDPMADARRLYAAAAYDQTLEALARLDDPEQLDEADEYRALCLLALRKDAEAERVVERLVLRHPLPDTARASRSPKLAPVYRTVRLRLVPRLASSSYSAAKASFESKDYDAAVRQFDEALELIRTAEDRGAMADLELVAAAFRALAEQLAGVDAAAAPVASVTPVEVPLSAGLTPGALPTVETEGAPAAERPAASETSAFGRPFTPIARVYDLADRDVLPPVVVQQFLPAWNPPMNLIRQRTFNGRLQIVVSEDGTVAEADIVQSSFAAYDAELLRSVRQWRYQPARKGDRPVRYRRVIDFVLRGDRPVSAQR